MPARKMNLRNGYTKIGPDVFKTGLNVLFKQPTTSLQFVVRRLPDDHVELEISELNQSREPKVHKIVGPANSVHNLSDEVIVLIGTTYNAGVDITIGTDIDSIHRASL